MSLARIEGDDVVIRVPIAALAEEHVIPSDLLDSEFRPKVRVTDAAAFAADFVHALNAEAENGDTMVHRLLDQAFTLAVGEGSEAVDYK